MENTLVQAYFWSAFIWVLQLPRIPGGSPMFSDGGGYALCRMLSPVTPSTKSSLRPLEAAASVMASRRSVRKGRFRTKIFWNFEPLADVRSPLAAKGLFFHHEKLRHFLGVHRPRELSFMRPWMVSKWKCNESSKRTPSVEFRMSATDSSCTYSNEFVGISTTCPPNLSHNQNPIKNKMVVSSLGLLMYQALRLFAG